MRIKNAVVTFIEQKMLEHERLNKAWLVHEFVNSHGELPEGDYDAEFYKSSAYLCASTEIGKAMKKVGDVKNQSELHPTLPGYERLQVAYPVKNSMGEVELVQTHLITDEQLLARADEYESQAKGLRAHAKEIRDYVVARSQQSFSA